MSRAFDVLIHDVLAGQLVEGDDGTITLRFATGYPELPHRPVVGQAFEDDLRRSYRGKPPGRLPHFFANLLPEGRLRAILEESLKLPADDSLSLLEAVSADLPGAVAVRRATYDTPTVDSVPVDNEAGHSDDGAPRFRFSLAGVQLKFSVVSVDNRLTVPAHGGHGDWIVKIGSADYDHVAENEYCILEWARATGFDVPEAQLLPPQAIPELAKYVPAGEKVLAIKRYDRVGKTKIHQEDFAQVLSMAPDRKYDETYKTIATLIDGLCGDAARDEFLRRLVLVVGSGNHDAHLKNWSLVYPNQIEPQLSPLYDQVATVAWPRLDKKLALKLAGIRESSRATLELFCRLVPKERRGHVATLASQTVERLRAAWSSLPARSQLPEAHAAAIRDHWARVPLLRQAGELD